MLQYQRLRLSPKYGVYSANSGTLCPIKVITINDLSALRIAVKFDYE